MIEMGFAAPELISHVIDHPTRCRVLDFVAAAIAAPAFTGVSTP
jgi:hypothetical protein